MLGGKAAAILIGATAAVSYSCIPDIPVGDAPFQAAWIAAGVALCSCLLQTILEKPDEKDDNRNTPGFDWLDQSLRALSIAILLTLRCWAVTVLGPLRVATFSFLSIRKGGLPLSLFALVSAWVGCMLSDFFSAADDFDAFLAVMAHAALLLATIVSPSSLTHTTPHSLMLAAALAATPVILHLYTDPLSWDFVPLVSAVVFGSVTLQLCQHPRLNSSEMHQITYPVAALLSFILAGVTSTFHILALVPVGLVYYAIFSIPPSSPATGPWVGFGHHRHPLLKRIMHKRDSRKIFFFLCLNLGFMCVQMGYGIYTNSLGLVSDSIHMLVDCAAIAFGLAASVLADDHSGNDGAGGSCSDVCDRDQHAHIHDHHEHSNSSRKPAGKWAKLEDLAGFTNAIFLVFVCLSILTEAIGRLVWPEDVVEVEQLLVVSILGLAVNLVGVFSFNHGYLHSSFFSQGVSHIGHSHGHHHHHHHHHHSSNMHGYESPLGPSNNSIFLHVLADTLGSVGVIASTLLIRHFNWSGFDPLASILIAILILASTVPLLKTTATSLLMINSHEREYLLRDVLGEIGIVPGVSTIEGVRNWDGGGTLRVRVKKDDLGVVKDRVARVLASKEQAFEGVCVDVARA